MNEESTRTERYMEKARELADSYPRLLEKRRELKKQIDESAAWLYTRDEVIYKLSQGAHEQGERVKTSGTSNHARLIKKRKGQGDFQGG